VTGYAVGATGKTTIVPPVISGRISMKQARKQAGEAYDISKGFLYGRIEIKAKIPRGDWLWPAMWMLPINNNNLGVTVNPQNPAGQGRYGVWPRSGEIDILESRGNSAKCSEAYMNTHPGEAFGGVQSFASTLHWGPYFKQNSFYKTHSEHYTDHGYVAGTTTRETLDQDFHVYGLRWSPLGIYTYIDHDDNRVLEVDFVKPFPQNGNSGFYHRGTQASSWCQQRFSHRGGQPTGINTCEEFIQELEEDIIAWLENPWEIGAGVCNPVAAPFDQPFYLIFNLAVGGTAGEGRDAYFPQGWCDKPWRNTEGYAVSDFITAKDQWYPSWQKGTPALQIQEIKYWKEENAGTFFALGPNAS
jgi:beta-glucanase (GH16 family)